MWVWKRVSRVNWTERKTNRWVRKRIRVKEDGIVKNRGKEKGGQIYALETEIGKYSHDVNGQ